MRILELLNELCRFMRQYGQEYYGGQVDKVIADLSSAVNDDQEREVLLYIREALTGGMGSWNDMHINLPAASRDEELAVNREADELLDRLYVEVNSALGIEGQ